MAEREEGLRLMAERWAEIVLERWIRRINELEVIDSGELLQSLQAHVSVDANGSPEKITFFYTWYGIFPDMGVGRGVRLGEQSETRHKKPWYSSVFIGQVNKLGRLMAERYGYDAANIPLQAFENLSGKELLNIGSRQLDGVRDVEI